MKILVIQQKKIGDVLTASVLFEALRKNYPSAELHYLVNSHTLPVLENNPYIDKIVEFTAEMQQSKSEFYKFLKSLKSQKYDALIDAYGKISSNLISFFANADKKIAFYKWYSSLLYTDTVKRIAKAEHHNSLAIEHRFQLLEPLGIAFEEIHPKLYLSKTEIAAAKAKLSAGKVSLDPPLIMVSVLGSMPKKTYPSEYMVELLDYCVKLCPDVQLLFNYVPGQKEDAEAIYRQTLSTTQDRIFFSIFGKSLREFMAITYHCDAMIGNEGGANNVAKALDLPTFTMFSPEIDKKNWFGEHDQNKHTALHPLEFIDSQTKAKVSGSKPHEVYKYMTPSKVKPHLNSFLTPICKSEHYKPGA